MYIHTCRKFLITVIHVNIDFTLAFIAVRQYAKKITDTIKCFLVTVSVMAAFFCLSVRRNRF
jgi:hypothetical protein